MSHLTEEDQRFITFSREPNRKTFLAKEGGRTEVLEMAKRSLFMEKGFEDFPSGQIRVDYFVTGTPEYHLNMFTLAGNPASKIAFRVVVPRQRSIGTRRKGEFDFQAGSVGIKTGVFPVGSQISLEIQPGPIPETPLIGAGTVAGAGGNGGVGGKDWDAANIPPEGYGGAGGGGAGNSFGQFEFGCEAHHLINQSKPGTLEAGGLGGLGHLDDTNNGFCAALKGEDAHVAIELNQDLTIQNEGKIVGGGGGGAGGTVLDFFTVWFAYSQGDGGDPGVTGKTATFFGVPQVAPLGGPGAKAIDLNGNTVTHIGPPGDIQGPVS